MGILTDAAHILTSSHGAALYLKKIRPNGARVYVIGEDGLRLPLIDAGFTVADEGAAEFVVLGMDRKLTYDKLRRATLLIRAPVALTGRDGSRGLERASHARSPRRSTRPRGAPAHAGGSAAC